MEVAKKHNIEFNSSDDSDQVVSQCDVLWNHCQAELSKRQLKIQTEIYNELKTLQKRYRSLFEWHDGPLVQAMKNGDLILVDEISLADDAILERLNSVLEPHRLLVLAEKGSEEIEELYAHENFRILATMNPGGDFGKKELSPAMRNRFTEIWVPSITDNSELVG